MDPFIQKSKDVFLNGLEQIDAVQKYYDELTKYMKTLESAAKMYHFRLKKEADKVGTYLINKYTEKYSHESINQ